MAFILKNLRWVLLPCLPRSQVLGGLSHVVLPPPPAPAWHFTGEGGALCEADLRLGQLEILWA